MGFVLERTGFAMLVSIDAHPLSKVISITRWKWLACPCIGPTPAFKKYIHEATCELNQFLFTTRNWQRQPHLNVLTAISRKAYLVVLVIALDQVLHNASRFEDTDCFAVGESIGDGGNAAIGIDLQEPGFFLRVLGHVNAGDLVR